MSERLRTPADNIETASYETLDISELEKPYTEEERERMEDIVVAWQKEVAHERVELELRLRLATDAKRRGDLQRAIESKIELEQTIAEKMKKAAEDSVNRDRGFELADRLAEEAIQDSLNVEFSEEDYFSGANATKLSRVFRIRSRTKRGKPKYNPEQVRSLAPKYGNALREYGDRVFFRLEMKDPEEEKPRVMTIAEGTVEGEFDYEVRIDKFYISKNDLFRLEESQLLPEGLSEVTKAIKQAEIKRE